MNRDTNHRWSALVKSFALACLCVAPWSLGATACGDDGSAIIYSKSSKFRIPFEFDPTELEKLGASEIQLYVSQNRGESWKLQESAASDQGSFIYSAEKDGEIWFSVRTLAVGGLTYPSGPHQPGLKVVVDTVAPVFKLDLQEKAPGELELTWSAEDEHFDHQNLKLEALNPLTKNWEAIPIEQTATGTFEFQVDTPGTIEVRGSARDLAGNEQVATSETTVVGVESAKTDLAQLTKTIENENSSDESLPNDNRSGAADQPALPFPDASEMGVTENASDDTKLIASTEDSRASASTEQIESEKPQAVTEQIDSNIPDWAQDQLPKIVPGDPDGLTKQAQNQLPALSEKPVRAQFQANPQPQPSLSESTSAQGNAEQKPTAQASRDELGQPDLAQQAGQQPVHQNVAIAQRKIAHPEPRIRPAGSHLVNSDTFRIGYQIDGVGPTGVNSVELYITEDHGLTWFHYGSDDDTVSPMEVKVPRDAEFGFTFRIRNGVGLISPPPQPGDKPEIVVYVDRSAPVVQLDEFRRSQTVDHNQVTILWQAADEEFSAQPVKLFYSEKQAGPWNSIAEPLPNSGEFKWDIPAEIKSPLYVRLEVSDAAGNVARVNSNKPILIDGAIPKAQVTEIEPVTRSAVQ